MAQIDWQDNQCFVCGGRSPHGLHVAFDGDQEGVHAESAISGDWQGYLGLVHGGILAGLADDAMWHAIYHQSQTSTLTAELKIRYKKPVKIDEPLQIEAQVVSSRRRLTVAKASITQAGQLVLAAEGRFMPEPESGESHP